MDAYLRAGFRSLYAFKTPGPLEQGYIYRNSHGTGFGRNHPLQQYRGQGCGLISEHDVYWRHIQSVHVSW